MIDMYKHVTDEPLVSASFYAKIDEVM